MLSNNFFTTETLDKNHLLNWFLLLFGNTGIQLKSFNYRNGQNFIHTLCNIIITVCINLYYNLIAIPLWDYDAIRNSLETAKALNNFMSIFGIYYLHAFLILIPILLNYIGPLITELISLSIFKNIYKNKRKSSKVMATILFIIILNCLEFTIFAGSLNMKNKRTFWTVIFEFFTNYYICIIYYISSFTLNYVKFATIEIFHNVIITNYNQQSKNIENIIKQISLIAKINRKLSWILSPMLSIAICTSSLDMIVLLMWFKGIGWNFFHTLLASLLTWFYIAYLIYLDNQIQQIFQQTIRSVIDNNLFKCCEIDN
ncbi:uncharacterized protein LOC142645221 [Dermatophagoides pteronyssinus]|uniref:uncharacterized protein LOC142645221 n=1 Tax=Dermatophagoides pteronyssinus TaxID=6956 RepID=UPI003F679E30